MSIREKLSSKGLNGYTKIESFTPNLKNAKAAKFLKLNDDASPSLCPSLTEELPKDKALLVLSSIFYTAEKQAIEYRMAIYRSDFYSFDITRNL